MLIPVGLKLCKVVLEASDCSVERFHWAVALGVIDNRRIVLNSTMLCHGCRELQYKL